MRVTVLERIRQCTASNGWTEGTDYLIRHRSILNDVHFLQPLQQLSDKSILVYLKMKLSGLSSFKNFFSFPDWHLVSISTQFLIFR